MNLCKELKDEKGSLIQVHAPKEEIYSLNHRKNHVHGESVFTDNGKEIAK